MTSFTVDYLPKPQPSSHSFNLCTFPENLPPSSFFIPQIPPNPDQISFQLLGNKEKRILKAENPKFEYIGKNFGENSEKNQENRYLLGVLSESKKRMKLFDIDHIFNMKQSKKLKTDDEIYYKTGQSSKLNALEQKQMLVAEFGTKKSKKKLQQMLNNVVEERNIASAVEMQDLLQEKAFDLEKKNDEQEDLYQNQELKGKRTFLPDFNLKATNPQALYDIHSIVSLDEWNDLNIKYALKIIKNESSPSRELRYYSDYVYEKLIKFYEIFDKKNKKNVNITFKLKILVYLDFLIKVFKYRSYHKPLEVISRELNIKPLFVQNILNRFYQLTPIQNGENTGFKYQRVNDDKMICYIIVLCLFFFDFQMEARGLSHSLKIDTKRFVLYCKEIGCSVVVKEDKKSDDVSIGLQLKAPLKLIIQKKEDINKLKKKKKS